MILVTGAAGHVGHRVVQNLVERGRRVRGMVHNRAKAERWLGDLDVELVEGDVLDPGSLRPDMQGVDTVVHLVAIAIEKGPVTYEDINYQGTLNVMDAAEEAGVERFIFMSQLGADPQIPYRFLRSKGLAQAAVEDSDFEWTIFRPSVIFGRTDEFANSLARFVLITPIVFPLIGGGQARFQPIWVGDVASCVAQAADDDGTVGAIYELGGPEILTIGEIERIVLETMGAGRMLVPAPVPLLRPVVKLMEVVFPNPPVTTSLLDLLGVDNTVQENAATEVFGLDLRPFKPANLAYMREFTIGGTFRKFFGRA